MKHTFTYFLALILLGLLACQPVAEVDDTPAPDYAKFDRNVEILSSFLQAHCDEDLPAMRAMLADTMRWNPATNAGSEWLGKEDFLATLETYHNDFENIKYQDGIVLPDRTENGMWSGSVFPQDLANSGASNVRQYGVWTATHSESGKDIALKWFALGNVNDDGKIVAWNEFFDVHGIAAQITEVEAVE